MNKRQERLGEFVVARGDASEMLEPCKEALDQIASAIEMPIELARCQAIGSGWNHRFCARRFDGGHEMVGIVALVGHHGLTGQIFDQCWGKVDIGNLPGREDDAQGIAQCVDGNVQFGRQSAARAADLLTARFFLGASGMLVGTNDGGIDEQLFHIGIATQHVSHALPDAAVAPAGKANVRAVPVAAIRAAGLAMGCRCAESREPLRQRHGCPLPCSRDRRPCLAGCVQYAPTGHLEASSGSS